MTTAMSVLLPRLLGAARQLDIHVTEVQCATLLRYLEQLQKWNRTYNLTALRDVEKMLIQHLFDSMALIPPLMKYLDTNQAADTSRPLVDVGSGGGLPGVVMAILLPQWQVHCVDAVEKKMAFVRQMAGSLKLGNLYAHHARIEALPPFNAQVVVSRAFASLEDFAQWSGVHVADTGCLLAMKGRRPDDEIEALDRNTGWSVDKVEPLNVPELDAQRCLVWMSRKESK